MRIISDEELKEILRKHYLWLSRGEGGERADLRGADLRGADLNGADLRGANLYGANLGGADLRGAILEWAYLGGADDIPYVPMSCPDTGNFVGWKKASGYIVKLYIPSDAKRSSATGRKCRCDKAIVMDIQKPNGEPANTNSVKSNYRDNFIYTKGCMVSVDDFCDNRFIECAPGIHFFINRQEAVEYI